MKIFISLLLLTLSSAWADGPQSCPGSGAATLEDIQHLAAKRCAEVKKASEFQLIHRNEGSSSITDLGLVWQSLRCIQGLGDSSIDLAKGLAFFAKLILKDAPLWVLNRIGDGARQIWESATNPFSGAIDASDHNAQKHLSVMELAKTYWKAFQNFIALIGKQIDQYWADFYCLPTSMQTQALCKLATDIFFTVVTPSKLVEGTNYAIQLTNGVQKLLLAIKATPEFQSAGTLAQNATKLAGRLSQKADKMTELLHLGETGVLRERVDAAGKKITEYFHKENGNWVTDTIIRDKKTLAIDANLEAGHALREDLVAFAARQATQGTPSAAVLFDVNYLGKVNYFAGKSGAGDEYLRAVGKVIRENLRKEDVFIKNGGDEFMLILPGRSAEEARAIAQRITNAVYKSPEVQAVFDNERKILLSQSRQLAQATRLENAPAELVEKLDAFQRSRPWNELKEALDLQLAEKLANQRPIRGSLSGAASAIQANDTTESLIQHLDNGLTHSKGQYKVNVGLPDTKYGGNTKPPSLPNFSVPPVIF